MRPIERCIAANLARLHKFQDRRICGFKRDVPALDHLQKTDGPFNPARIRNTDNRRVQHARQPRKYLLQFERTDPFAAGLDNIFQPVPDDDLAITAVKTSDADCGDICLAKLADQDKTLSLIAATIV